MLKIRRSRRIKVSGLNCRMLETSVELMGFHLGKTDYCVGALTGAMVLAISSFSGGVSSELFPAVLSGVFATGLFLCIRRLLPMFLQMNAIDMLRYRYSFLAVCSASVLAIALTRSYDAMFSQVGLLTVARLSALAAVLLAIRYLTRGGRFWLAFAYFFAGIAWVRGVTGLLVLILIWMVFSLIGHSVMRVVGSYPEDEVSESAEHAEVAEIMSRFATAGQMRIMCAISFFGGLLVALVTGYLCVGGGSRSVFLLRAASHYGSSLVAVVMGNAGVMLAMALVALFLSMMFARRATNVERRLTNGPMMLYAALFGFSLIGLSGLVTRLPPFRGDTSADLFLLPYLLFGWVLVFSGSVLLVELCCRSEVMLRWYDPDVAPSRRQVRFWNNLRSGAFSLFVLVAVLAIGWYMRFR